MSDNSTQSGPTPERSSSDIGTVPGILTDYINARRAGRTDPPSPELERFVAKLICQQLPRLLKKGVTPAFGRSTPEELASDIAPRVMSRVDAGNFPPSVVDSKSFLGWMFGRARKRFLRELEVSANRPAVRGGAAFGADGAVSGVAFNEADATAGLEARAVEFGDALERARQLMPKWIGEDKMPFFSSGLSGDSDTQAELGARHGLSPAVANRLAKRIAFCIDFCLDVPFPELQKSYPGVDVAEWVARLAPLRKSIK